jgi:hypothetical protein
MSTKNPGASAIINSNWATLKLFKMYARETLVQEEIYENLQDAINWVTSG